MYDFENTWLPEDTVRHFEKNTERIKEYCKSKCKVSPVVIHKQSGSIILPDLELEINLDYRTPSWVVDYNNSKTTFSSVEHVLLFLMGVFKTEHSEVY